MITIADQRLKIQEEQWDQLYEFLRTCPQIKIGSPRRSRRFMEAVLWMSENSTQWRLLPAEYGKWNSVYKRFISWYEVGVWDQMQQRFASDPSMEHVLPNITAIRARP